MWGNNGTVPGGNYAFLQTGGVLKTTVSGLTIGTTYHVSFRANAATGSLPYLTFSTDASAKTLRPKAARRMAATVLEGPASPTANRRPAAARA